ncbi:hypothetical protein [Nocardiopsis rhodophaea]|uniref:hypothetical protein n=1 Tax=Nocardiopsis rhodophaea TaxID=280238 RepID=UPI0031D7845B
MLEETDAGKKLDAYRLYENNVLRTLERDYDVKRTDVMGARDDAWSALSDSYAKAARGEVQVFAADVAAKSVLGKDELPALRANPHVGVEQIRFAVDMPRHDYLPEDVDEFLSNDAVRAQVPMEYYLKDGPDPDMRNDLRISPTASPPHVLADRCEKIAVPAHLETQRQGIVGRLRSASSFADVEDRDRSHSTGTVAEAGTVQTTGKVFGGGTGIASTSSVSSGAAENAGAESTMPAAMSAGKRKSPHGKTSSSTSPAGEMSHLDRSRSASRSSTTRQVHSGGHR